MAFKPFPAVLHRVMDFETGSACDLKKAGAWRYAEDPTTEIICLSFEARDMKVLTWTPDDYFTAEVIKDLIEDPAVIFVKHSDFERAIWRRIMVPLHGFPDIPDERWHDSQAVAAQKGLPLDLDTLSAVLGCEGKDMEGNKLVKEWSRFDRKGNYVAAHTPENLARIIAYCESDVRNERGVLNIVRDFQPGERDVWLLDQKINERGLRIDLDYVVAAQRIVDGATPPLVRELMQITDGLAPTQTVALRKWVNDQGVPIPDLTKETLKEALGYDPDAEEDSGADDYDTPAFTLEVALPERVRRALEIRQLVGSASIKKLDRMLTVVGADGRARGLLQYHGAGPGRWAGRLLQPHNFPRPTLRIDDKPVPVELIVSSILTSDWRFVQQMVGPPVETVVSGLRHALIADRGKRFLSGDFATIECRLALAVAGQWDKIAIFEASDRGETQADGRPFDVYCDMAEKIYKVPVDKKRDVEKRQTGKNSVLGLGFQMGDKTFQRKYARKHPLPFCTEIVRVYRKEWAPEVPDVWYGLYDASTEAVYSGRPVHAYGVTYQLEGKWLTALLPSGRKLYYFNPRPVKRVMPWSTPEDPDIRPGWTYQAMKMGTWRTIYPHGGHLLENVAQALARDLLTGAMFRLEREGFEIVLTVHDEIVSETASSDEKAFEQIMMERPEWARQLRVPVKVETWEGDRYRK